MSASLNSFVIESSPKPGGGSVWHRLHSEREAICAAMLNESAPDHETTPENALRPASWRLSLLQARLHKVDNALDRLVAGSYGNCSKCGKWIEDTKLDFDPAIAFCISCWEQMQTEH